MIICIMLRDYYQVAILVSNTLLSRRQLPYDEGLKKSEATPVIGSGRLEQ